MRAYYTDRFVLPLPAGHRFPMAKYSALRNRIARELPAIRLIEPPAASDGVLALAHHPDWIRDLGEGRVDAARMRAIGFPWSPQMVERSRRSVGATIEAARSAFVDGVSVNLAGGTHHAGHDRGEGFCCFNDLAVAARLMQAEGRARRVAIIDLDVHQGNGTARILERDDSVFTLSIHAQSNYPFRKATSDLDVGLPDGTGDETYLEALELALLRLAERFEPDLILYLAGADVYHGDRLGRLALSEAGIAERDRRVFAFARSRGLPVAVAMGGGYCPDLDRVVDIHFATVAEAARLLGIQLGADRLPEAPASLREQGLGDNAGVSKTRR